MFCHYRTDRWTRSKQTTEKNNSFFLLLLTFKVVVLNSDNICQYAAHSLRATRAVQACRVLCLQTQKYFLGFRVEVLNLDPWNVSRSYINTVNNRYRHTRCRHNRVIGTKIVWTDFPPSNCLRYSTPGYRHTKKGDIVPELIHDVIRRADVDQEPGEKSTHIVNFGLL